MDWLERFIHRVMDLSKKYLYRLKVLVGKTVRLKMTNSIIRTWHNVFHQEEICHINDFFHQPSCAVWKHFMVKEYQLLQRLSITTRLITSIFSILSFFYKVFSIAKLKNTDERESIELQLLLFLHGVNHNERVKGSQRFVIYYHIRFH